MRYIKHLSLVGTLTVGCALAQTPPPQSTQPEAASSPHQREVTGESAAETPANTSPEAKAASTPHQKEVMAGEASGKAEDASGADPATFVKKASQGGMTEVELGKLAAGKTGNAAVRAFAARMVKDHGQANMELSSIAKRKNLQPATALDAEHQAMVDELRAKSGSEFDAAYAKMMMSAHDKTIGLFEGAAKSSDKDLAAFATKTLPTVKEHKRMAETLPGS